MSDGVFVHLLLVGIRKRIVAAGTAIPGRPTARVERLLGTTGADVG